MNFKHRTWKAFAAKPAGRLASWGLPKIPFDRRGDVVGLFKNIASSGLNFAWPPPPTFLRLDPSIYFNSSSTLWSETWKKCIQFQSGKNYIFVGCKNGFFFRRFWNGIKFIFKMSKNTFMSYENGLYFGVKKPHCEYRSSSTGGSFSLPKNFPVESGELLNIHLGGGAAPNIESLSPPRLPMPPFLVKQSAMRTPFWICCVCVCVQTIILC